jgi:hypothetical protein
MRRASSRLRAAAAEKQKRAQRRDHVTQLAFALLLLISKSAASHDLPVIGPCDVALEQMEAVLVARVDGVTLEEYAETHSAEMMVVATVIYKAKDPAAEIQRRYEECLREQ